ncbi:hypothetical protein ACFFMR_30975 [Micromonospora andamanensis]|uniref:Uncharacterized protein n=1 Tax=Micromonospora andamanensis TaxID=1287068 RepID=A0ABQ4I492_9ACTN|nr:hypothetical protein [Micromonospora andamanensis]GIJ12721.1 hypothetical protein Van01_59350 [Micromonospora andamanensis]
MEVSPFAATTPPAKASIAATTAPRWRWRPGQVGRRWRAQWVGTRRGMADEMRLWVPARWWLAGVVG